MNKACNFNPNLSAYQSQISETIERELVKAREAICTAEGRWIDACAKGIFPLFIYNAAHEGRNLRLVARWLERNGYHIRRHIGGKVEFAKGDQILSNFKVEMVNIQH